jgi:hypothetical protein
MGVTKILEKGTKVVTDMKRKAKTTAGFVEQGKDLSRYKRKRLLAFSKMKIHGRWRRQRLKNFPRVVQKTPSS